MGRLLIDSDKLQPCDMFVKYNPLLTLMWSNKGETKDVEKNVQKHIF